MLYRLIKFILICIFVFSCDQSINNKKSKFKNNELLNKYQNSGFTLVYNESLINLKKIDNRSLNIYHKNLKKKSLVKITNPENGKYLIANVKSNRIKFSNFYNSVISLRIAEELELDLSEPLIELVSISKDSTFVAKKAKMFKEEKKVAEKVPVDGIQISDLNVKKIIKKSDKRRNFSYSIKVADFYYKDTAYMMIERIKKITLIKNLTIVRLSETKYRVLIGPFNDIKSLQDSFEKMNSFNFENLEILKNA